MAYDTYEERQAARDKGYYIDNSGVYAPGSGERVSDTWSGANAPRNEAPSPTRLPIVNGTPVSPSNGFTGVQTPAIMYRGDPLYSQYFGAGTPGYSSTSMQANALPGALPAGQDTLPPQRPSPAPATAPAVTAPGTNTSVTNAGAKPQAPDYAAEFQGANPQGGFGPYMTNAAPALTVETRYTENGKIIEKSVDQFGNPYYKEVGQASITVGQQGDQPGGTPGGQPQTVPGEPTDPATFGGPQDLVPLAMPDGKVVQVPREFYKEYLAAGEKQAAAAKAAAQFQEGIQQGQLDVQRMVATYNAEYQKALISGQNADRAQQLAIEAMRNDLQKQSLELQKQLQAQQAQYQQQQIELQRSGQAQTVSLEREKLQLQRSQSRGRRRLPQVRYK